MLDSRATATDGLRIEIAPDRMTATLFLSEGATATVEAVVAAAASMQIESVDRTAIAKAVSRRQAATIIAAGTPPIDEQADSIDCRIAVTDDLTGRLAKVRDGQMLATLGAAVAGVDGRDVLGGALPFRKIALFTRAGKNVTLDGGRFTADAYGNLHLTSGVLSVEPLLELHDGKLDTATQTDFAGDIAVTGHIGHGSKLKADGAVYVQGSVGAAHVVTNGPLNIRAGIAAFDKGRCIADGNVWVRSIDRGCVIGGGLVEVKSNVENSRVVCGGKLLVADGTVVGGKMMANGGIECRTAGDTNGTPTVLEAGTEKIAMVIAAAAKMEITEIANRAKLIREKTEPLLKQMRTLDAKQRERVTEFTYEAELLDEKASARTAQLNARCQAMAATRTGQILITGTLHAGVLLRMGTLEARVQTTRQGPVRAIFRISDGKPELLLIDVVTGAETVLESQIIDAGNAIEPVKQAA